MIPSSLTVASVLVVLVSACASEGTAPAARPSVGIWNQGANLRDSVNKQTHIHTGYFSFSQAGNGFTGTGEQSGFCHGANGDYVGPLAEGTPFKVTDGVQQGDRVLFKTDLCSYEGALSEDHDHMNGTVRCAYIDNGVSFVWQGDWLANRER